MLGVKFILRCKIFFYFFTKKQLENFKSKNTFNIKYSDTRFAIQHHKDPQVLVL